MWYLYKVLKKDRIAVRFFLVHLKCVRAIWNAIVKMTVALFEII
jgi:hypothetical protein